MSSTDSSATTPALQKIHPKKDPKEVTDEEWKRNLSAEEYDVTRKAGTEAPFSGKYDKFFEPGTYHCLCCGAELFISDHKYNSGCGWPAFFKSVGDDRNIIRVPDNSHGSERVEVRCRQCNAHLGHVFDDGPRKETGERYCINSVAINFNEKSEEKK